MNPIPETDSTMKKTNSPIPAADGTIKKTNNLMQETDSTTEKKKINRAEKPDAPAESVSVTELYSEIRPVPGTQPMSGTEPGSAAGADPASEPDAIIGINPPFEPDAPMAERFGKCPYATAQSLISGKWSVLILHYLADGPIRFNELQRRMPKMTHATLSVQLKALVKNGLVKRIPYESALPRVEYSLTGIGEKFLPVLDALRTWGAEYIDYLKESSDGESSPR